MFGTKKARAGINLVRVEKGQASSRPLSRQRSSTWEKQRGDHMMVPSLERQVP